MTWLIKSKHTKGCKANGRKKKRRKKKKENPIILYEISPLCFDTII
jgi:hypothetical protein